MHVINRSDKDEKDRLGKQNSQPLPVAKLEYASASKQELADAEVIFQSLPSTPRFPKYLAHVLQPSHG